MEGQDGHSGCGGAFGKHQHRLPVQKGAGNFVAGLAGFATAALNEQRARLRGQPTDHRPAAHFRFGQETQGHLSAKYRNVRPGDMVADVKHGLFAEGALRGHAKAKAATGSVKADAGEGCAVNLAAEQDLNQ